MIHGRMSNGSLLKLLIVNGIGKPLENVRVVLDSAPVPVPDIAAMSDDQGEASIWLPAAGRYDISFYADGYKPSHLEMDAREENVIQTLVLERNE